MGGNRILPVYVHNSQAGHMCREERSDTASTACPPPTQLRLLLLKKMMYGVCVMALAWVEVVVQVPVGRWLGLGGTVKVT